MELTKKPISLLLVLLMILSLAACSQSGKTTPSPVDDLPFRQTGKVVATVEKDENAFSDVDFADATTDEPDAVITLSGASGSISDSARGSSGKTVTVTSGGVYRITGSSEGVSIVVNDKQKSGEIYLILDNVQMVNPATACICVQAAEKVIVQSVGENELTSSSKSADGTVDAAIWTASDLTINGSGILTVVSGLNGIFCKSDLRITSGSLWVTAKAAGLKAQSSVRITEGTVNVDSGGEGVAVENDDGRFYMDSGFLSVTSALDGINAGTKDAAGESNLTLAGGEITVKSGGGAGKPKGSLSQKGLMCSGDICVGAVKLTVSSADDALHSSSCISITDGSLILASADDGVHADSTLSISGGAVTVNKSLEGLRAFIVDVSGGTVRVTASDDGISAAGGSDSSSAEKTPWGASAPEGCLKISGGRVNVSAEGDGLDSSGSLYVSGGLVIVEGPTRGGNAAIDFGDGKDCVASITGGTVLAIGSTDTAVNFNAGSQCSALASVSGNAGVTISVSDGSGFSYTTTKSFGCVLYSSPEMSAGSRYKIKAGASTAIADFSSGLFYSDVRAGA